MTAGKVSGFHFTPVENYRDTFSFSLKPISDSACALQGHSSSDIWSHSSLVTITTINILTILSVVPALRYAYLDLGTNYCNIANLVYGAGLGDSAGFTESTDNCHCTQYDKRNCTIY